MSLMDVPEEEWRHIRGFEGVYQVSNLGRVRSLDRVSVFHQSGRKVSRPIKGKLREPADRLGYETVHLNREGKPKAMQVHRLVAEAFLPNPENLPFVLHWDDDRKNNRADNLRWGSASDNSFDAVRNGRHPWAKKTHCKRGHEFTEENTRRYGTSRHCRACEKLKFKEGLSKEDPRHGTNTGYANWKCRCDPCMEAGKRMYREWKEKNVPMD